MEGFFPPKYNLQISELLLNQVYYMIRSYAFLLS